MTGDNRRNRAAIERDMRLRRLAEEMPLISQQNHENRSSLQRQMQHDSKRAKRQGFKPAIQPRTPGAVSQHQSRAIALKKRYP